MPMKLYLFITLFFTLTCCNVYANEADGALAAIKSLNYVSKHQENVWPGFKVDTMPIFLYFEDSGHSYAYQFTPKNAQWKRLNIDNTPIYFLGNDALNFQKNMEDFQTVDGVFGYIFNFVNYESEDDTLFSVRHLINRRFSYYLTNESTFPRKMFSFWNADYEGFNQMENVEYTYLEVEELKNFLLKKDIESLKNYLAIHHVRHNLIDKKTADFEDTNEIRFGMGAYVGFKALNLSENDYLKQVLLTYNTYLTCPSYETVQQIEYCISLAHYYLTGPAMGYALDKAQGNKWKAAIEKTATTPQLLLEKIYPMNDNEIAQRVAKSKSTYHFDMIKQRTETKMKYYLNEMKIQQTTYAKLPGVEFHIDYRYCSPTKYSDKFREEFNISNRKTLYTYYDMTLECNIKGSLIKINFKRIPFLIKMDSILNTQFKMADDTKISIDGKQEIIKNILTPSAQIRFHQLKIENPNVNIEINGNGLISESKGVLRLSS